MPVEPRTRSSRSKSFAGRRRPSGAPTRSTASSTSSRRRRARCQGTSVRRSASARSTARSNGNGAANGSLFYVRGTHAQAVNDRWAYKISAGDYTSDALRAADRPRAERRATTPYPPYHERGHDAAEVRRARGLRLRRTAQQAVDVGRRRRHDGIMHIGHRAVRHQQRRDDELLARSTTRRRRFKLQAFMNVLDGDATNSCRRRPDRHAHHVRLRHRRRSTSKSATSRSSARITCSPTAATSASTASTCRSRRARTTAPRAAPTCRTSVPQRPVPAVAGRAPRQVQRRSTARCSRRAWRSSCKPNADNTFRVSYNRAFRAPSVVNNYLQRAIANAAAAGR